MRRPIAIIFITAILLLLIATDWFPYLRGPRPDTEEWHWLYSPNPLKNWLPALLITFPFLLSTFHFLKPKAKPLLPIALITLLHFLLQCALVYADRGALLPELIDRTLAPLTTGYFWTAAQIPDIPSLQSLLRDYPAAMPTFDSVHPRTHPPGLIILNHITIEIVQTTGWLTTTSPYLAVQRCADLWLLDASPEIPVALTVWSIIPLICASLTIPITYLITRNRFATTLVATIPALTLFAPQPDQIYAPLAMLSLFPFAKNLSVDTPSSLFISNYSLFISGFCLSFASFLSLGAATPALIIGFLLLLHYIPKRNQPLITKHLILNTISFSVGCLSIWLIYWAIYGISPYEIATVSLDQHHTLVNQYRRYDWWLWGNWVDMLVWTAFPIIFGAIFSFRKNNLAKATLLTLLILTLSGSTRGETARLWIFFMPILAVAAAVRTRLAVSPHAVSPQRTIIACQLAITLALGFFWKPLDAVLVQPTRADITIDFYNTRSTPLVEFETGIEIADLRFQKEGDALELDLIWQATEQQLRPYTLFIHAIDDDDNIVSQYDGWPLQNSWPPTCWTPNTELNDTVSLPNANDATALRIGFYDKRDNGRLKLLTGDDFYLVELPQN